MNQWSIKSKLLFITRHENTKCYGSTEGEIMSTGGLGTQGGLYAIEGTGCGVGRMRKILFPVPSF